jgi:hypothetical protein
MKTRMSSVIHLTLFTVTSFVFNQQFIITMKTF